MLQALLFEVDLFKAFRKTKTPKRSLEDLQLDYPELKDAERVWREFLQPELTALESKRQNMLMIICLCAIGVVLTAFAHVFVPTFTASLPALPFLFYAGAVCGIGWALSQANQVTKTAHKIIFPVACSLFHFNFNEITDDAVENTRRRFVRRASRTPNGKAAFFGMNPGIYEPHREAYPELADLFDSLNSYRILPRHDYAEFEDLITGERHGAPLRSFEARLIDAHVRRNREDGKSDEIKLKQHFVHIVQTQIDKQFRGRTMIRRKQGFFSGFKAKLDLFDDTVSSMQKVKLESPEFGKQFEAFGADQVETRYILTPDIMDAVTRLSKRYHSQELAIVFENNSVILCLRGDDKFEPQHFLKALDQQPRFMHMVNELVVITDMIDALRSPEWLHRQLRAAS